MGLGVNNVTVVRHLIRYHPTIHPGEHKDIAFVVLQSSLTLGSYKAILFQGFISHQYDGVVKWKEKH